MAIIDEIKNLEILKEKFTKVEDERLNILKEYNQFCKRLFNDIPSINKKHSQVAEKLNEIDKKRKILMSKIWEVDKLLMNENFIDCYQMLNLLSSQTGLRWQIVSISGPDIQDFGDYGHSTDIRDCGNYFRLALINENNRYYNKFAPNKDQLQDEELENDTIIAAAGQTQDSNLRKPIYENFNWMHYYLYLKGYFPKNTSAYTSGKFNDTIPWSRKKDKVEYYFDDVDYSSHIILKSMNLHKELIIKAIEEYLKDTKNITITQA